MNCTFLFDPSRSAAECLRSRKSVNRFARKSCVTGLPETVAPIIEEGIQEPAKRKRKAARRSAWNAEIHFCVTRKEI